MSKRILLIDAHPARKSLCSALAGAYGDAARAAGATVETLALRDLDFDPILHEGYSLIQQWEPDLDKAWAAIERAEHFCLVYPTWWGGHPALLQGFFERVFVPGKAFKYHDSDPWWDRLLAGRSADVLTTMDTPPWFYRLAYRNSGVVRLKKTILEFTGIRTRAHLFGPVRKSDPKKRDAWFAKAAALGRAAAA